MQSIVTGQAVVCPPLPQTVPELETALQNAGFVRMSNHSWIYTNPLFGNQTLRLFVGYRKIIGFGMRGLRIDRDFLYTTAGTFEVFDGKPLTALQAARLQKIIHPLLQWVAKDEPSES